METEQITKFDQIAIRNLMSENDGYNSRLSKTFEYYRSEFFLFEKMIYKYKNQHRTAVHYKKLLEVILTHFRVFTFPDPKKYSMYVWH